MAAGCALVPTEVPGGGSCQHRTAVCLPEGGCIQATVCQLIVLEVQLPESRLEAQGSSGHLGDKIVLEEGESEVEIWLDSYGSHRRLLREGCRELILFVQGSQVLLLSK